MVFCNGDQICRVIASAATPRKDMVGFQMGLCGIGYGEHCGIAEIARGHPRPSDTAQKFLNPFLYKLVTFHDAKKLRPKKAGAVFNWKIYFPNFLFATSIQLSTESIQSKRNCFSLGLLSYSSSYSSRFRLKASRIVFSKK